jgi:hypothetical protein
MWKHHDTAMADLRQTAAAVDSSKKQIPRFARNDKNGAE